MKLCLHVHIKRFKAMHEATGMAVSSIKIIFGFKVHIAANAEGTLAIFFAFQMDPHTMFAF
jgi:hypothetical protein